jgi:hypothetical protein
VEKLLEFESVLSSVYALLVLDSDQDDCLSLGVSHSPPETFLFFWQWHHLLLNMTYEIDERKGLRETLHPTFSSVRCLLDTVVLPDTCPVTIPLPAPTSLF